MMVHTGNVQDGGKQQNYNRSVSDVNPHNASPSRFAVREHWLARWRGLLG